MYYVHWVWEMLATYLLSVAYVQRGKALRGEAFVCLTDRLTDQPTDGLLSLCRIVAGRCDAIIIQHLFTHCVSVSLGTAATLLLFVVIT